MGLGGGTGVVDLVELSKDAEGNFSVRGSNEGIKSIDTVETECFFSLFLGNIDREKTKRERYELYVMQNNLDANAYLRISEREEPREAKRCDEIIQFYRIETEEVIDGKSI